MSTPRARFGLHPAHRLWRLLPARDRRRALGAAAALLAPHPARNPARPAGGLVVVGDLDSPSGLGEAARLVMAGLASLGVPHWGMVPGQAVPAGLPPHAPLLLHVNSPQMPLAMLRLPRALLRQRRVIGYWNWELPSTPPEWRIGTRFVHDVWVPTEFTRAAIEPLLPGHVTRAGLPLTAAPPRPSALGRADFGLPESALVTLVSFNLASSFVRKNPLAAIAAHRAAFGDQADRILVLKIGNPDHFPDDFAAIRAALGTSAPNIRIDTRTYPGADSLALTRAADIVMSLHRAEGFGLVPAEAMLLGRPVIATGWSGNMDFMAAGAAALVDYRLVPARDPRLVYDLPGAQWAEADIGQAAGWLTRLADDAGLRASMGEAGRALAQARLGTEALAAAVRGLGLAA